MCHCGQVSEQVRGGSCGVWTVGPVCGTMQTMLTEQ